MPKLPEPTEARNMSRRALASLALYRLFTAVSSKGIELEGELPICSRLNVTIDSFLYWNVIQFRLAVQRVKGQRKGNRLETEVRDDYECLFWLVLMSRRRGVARVRTPKPNLCSFSSLGKYPFSLPNLTFCFPRARQLFSFLFMIFLIYL